MPDIGMSAAAGSELTGRDHLAQSIQDILSTPIGTRVMRRDYGSDLFNLLDAPLNDETLIDVYAAVAAALQKWEPRFRLSRVQAFKTEAGRLTIDLAGKWWPGGKEITLEGLVV